MEKKIITEFVNNAVSFEEGDRINIEDIEAIISEMKEKGADFIGIEIYDDCVNLNLFRERLETDNELKERIKAENEMKSINKEYDISRLKELIQRHGKEEVQKIINQIEDKI